MGSWGRRRDKVRTSESWLWQHSMITCCSSVLRCAMICLFGSGCTVCCAVSSTYSIIIKVLYWLWCTVVCWHWTSSSCTVECVRSVCGGVCASYLLYCCMCNNGIYGLLVVFAQTLLENERSEVTRSTCIESNRAAADATNFAILVLEQKVSTDRRELNSITGGKNWPRVNRRGYFGTTMNLTTINVQPLQPLCAKPCQLLLCAVCAGLARLRPCLIEEQKHDIFVFKKMKLLCGWPSKPLTNLGGFFRFSIVLFQKSRGLFIQRSCRCGHKHENAYAYDWNNWKKR